MKPAQTVSLTPGRRVLFLTKDPALIRRQLRGELDLRMEGLRVEDLMDDINTDAMTPAWACFDYRPEDIARNAYAGITVNKERLFPEGSLMAGGRFPFPKACARGEVELPAAATTPRPMNIAEKILAAHVVGTPGPVFLAPGDAVCVRVDGGYSHEFTTAQVAYFLAQEFGPDY